MRPAERGEGLIDAIIAVAILATLVSAVLGAIVASTQWVASSTIQRALQHVTECEARVAVDILKYRGGSIAPLTIATTAPLPGGSPLPVHLSIAAVANGDGSTTVTVSAQQDAGSVRASSSVRVPQPVPVPSSDLNATGNGSAPL